MFNDDKKLSDVFLSHAHLDSECVEVLAKKLVDEAGIDVWLDKWKLIPGEHWQQAIVRGLDQAKSCAVIIGSKTPSGWFKEEIERALNRQSKDNFFRVIPVLLDNAQNVNVDDFLELRTWVEFKNDIHDKRAFHILISGIRGEPPGRYIEDNPSDLIHKQADEDLFKIRKLLEKKLIDKKIHLEFQRKILKKMIKS